MNESSDTLIGRELYLRYTDKHGNVTVQRHRVYDAEKFLHARFKEAFAEGGDVDLATEEAFLGSRKARK